MIRSLTLSLTCALVLAACGDKESADSGSASGGGDAANGETLYATKCQSCHGVNGTGQAESGVSGAADLSVEADALSDSAMVDVILNGQGGMPAINVSQAEAEDITAYVKQAFGS